MLCFYPVDVYKTSLQADDQESMIYSDESRQQSSSMHQKRLSRQISTLSTPLNVADLFRGLNHKVVHTIVSSFTYFFVYSLVNTKYLSFRRGNTHSVSSSSTSSQPLQNKTSTIAKLILTAFSAMINTAITLPFDTISSRIQAGRHNGLSDGEEDQTQSCVKEVKSINGDLLNMREERHYIKKFSLNTNLPREAFERRNTITDKYGEKRIQRLRAILSLWNGLLPAILLCTNPAIQYTMFENLKSALLYHRSSQHQGSKQRKGLAMWEAFIFGLVSKFFATMMTYPLIRAKVMLMVSSPDVFDDDQEEEVEGDDHDDDYCKDDLHHQGDRNGTNRSNRDANSNRQPVTKKHPRSLPLLLVSIYRNDGTRGLYRGCSVQLLHTILKSALMLMIRERITSVCHRLFLVDEA
jgi:hypothetical protein